MLASFRPPALDEMAAQFRAMTPEQRATLAARGRRELVEEAGDGTPGAPGTADTDDDHLEPFGPDPDAG